MAKRTTKSKGPKPVDAITHEDKRVNLPTADAQEFVAPETETPIPLRYPRDPSRDPQLVWKGKDELDGEDLVAEAPPIYIQEKIDPRVLVENLRDTAAKPEEEPELQLFDTFDGLGELDLIEFYRHQANWSNRMILGDSLNVMASLAEREALRGKVQMIYIDPPYGIKFNSNWQVSARSRDVKDGRVEHATREVEQIKAFRDTWEKGINSYLTYLRDRLVVARDLLTESGSCFVQIGDENVHLVRSLMDEVFGSQNFVGQIYFKTTSGRQDEHLDRTGNYVLWFAKEVESLKSRTIFDAKSVREGDSYDAGDLQSQGVRSTGSYSVEVEGKAFQPQVGNHWKVTEQGMNRLLAADRVHVSKTVLRFKRFAEDFPVERLPDVWVDTGGGAGRDKIYVVQTGVKVVMRCMLMCTDPGDLVLDPTCGSGTTAYVAEQWGRRWITIDTSRVALALARQRLMGAKFPHYLLADSPEGRRKEGELAGAPLPAAETRGDIHQGFVYERVRHITLKSIANNPDIKEGMSREEIDAAIRRHAEFELLYDKPYEDKQKVRVSGPFTVESLSPHRSLAFAGSAVDATGARNEDAERSVGEEPSTDGSPDDVQFEQTILENLRTAGIQTGEKDKRIELGTLEPYAAAHIQAIGERAGANGDSPKRIGITIGPQYGTVGPGFIKDAAREANRAGDIDLLCVLGFAFDPQVVGSEDDEYVAAEDDFASVAGERRLGKVPVLLVRMNADLVMGEELKKTGAGNLFTVFGEPDIEIAFEGDEIRVILHGVDVYDPNTGELRSNDTDQIALWMVDTAYNGESFFVRHCYFTGGQDPYKRLKSALRAEIDQDTWASLNTTASRPFPRPESGKIAIKVINDYGDEVMKVFELEAG
ncbi:MAG TPA: site-specific DNA-methyltransferase [Solirubrobacterales bacterium]|nr:site-specific DNA-methyltransferase [Solirubrobacterales bacterium]